METNLAKKGRKIFVVGRFCYFCGKKNCKVSEITLAELLFGAFKSGQQKHFRDVDVIKSLFEHDPNPSH